MIKIKTIKHKIAECIYGTMTAITDFVHKFVLELIILAFIFMGLCWAIGYFCNAVYGMKFELQSCWGGFSAIGGAGVLASVKYCMDSWKNTPAGVAPDYAGRNKNAAEEFTELASNILKNHNAKN